MRLLFLLVAYLNLCGVLSDQGVANPGVPVEESHSSLIPSSLEQSPAFGINSEQEPAGPNFEETQAFLSKVATLSEGVDHEPAQAPSLVESKSPENSVHEESSVSVDVEPPTVQPLDDSETGKCDRKVSVAWTVPSKRFIQCPVRPVLHEKRRAEVPEASVVPSTQVMTVATEEAPRPTVPVVEVVVSSDVDLSQNDGGDRCPTWPEAQTSCTSKHNALTLSPDVLPTENTNKVAESLLSLTIPPLDNETPDGDPLADLRDDADSLLTGRVIETSGINNQSNATIANDTSINGQSKAQNQTRVAARNAKQERLVREIVEKREKERAAKAVLDANNTAEHGVNGTQHGNATLLGNGTDTANETDAKPTDSSDTPPSDVALTRTEYEEKIRNKTQLNNTAEVAVTSKKGKGSPKAKSLLVNYASVDCGAKIRLANPSAKAESKVLDKNKDAYMLSPCGDKKFIVIELCEDIYIETLAIGNFEFHSSMFREFHVLGSSKFPTNSWLLLGVFDAENSRDMQNFTISEPAWVRFIQIRFVSHYGSEYYCTISLVKVHGSNYIEHLADTITKKDTKKEILTSAISSHSNETKSAYPEIQALPANDTSPNATIANNSTDGNEDTRNTSSTTAAEEQGVIDKLQDVVVNLLPGFKKEEDSDPEATATQTAEDAPSSDDPPHVGDGEKQGDATGTDSSGDDAPTSNSADPGSPDAEVLAELHEAAREVSARVQDDIPSPETENPPEEGDEDLPEDPTVQSPLTTISDKIRQLDEALTLTQGYLDDFFHNYKSNSEKMKTDIESVRSFQSKVDNQTLEDVAFLKKTIQALPTRIRKTLDFYAEELSANVTRSLQKQRQSQFYFRLEILAYVILGVLGAVVLVRVFPPTGSPRTNQVASAGQPTAGPGQSDSRNSRIMPTAAMNRQSKKGRYRGGKGIQFANRNNGRHVGPSPLSKPPTHGVRTQSPPSSRRADETQSSSATSPLSRSRSSGELTASPANGGTSTSSSSLHRRTVSGTVALPLPLGGGKQKTKGKNRGGSTSSTGSSTNMFEALDLHT